MSKESKSKTSLITHEMSNIGRLNINLYGVAAEFYSIAETDGLIEYLKRLDHLGFIAKSHPGNNHKRWDYICLQLFLIQKLKHSAFNTGLSSKLKVGTDEISHLEILQLFILLANVGHLEGTISSESALFDYIKTNPAAKDEFLSNINNNAIFKSLAELVLATNDVYKIKYLISLNYILSRNSNSQLITILESIISSFLIGNEKIEKIRNIYFRVRRICFVYLDSHHCHTPLQLNISKILINIFNFDELFNPVEHDYDKILDASETILTKQIYISPQSSLSYKVNYEGFFQYLNRYNSGGKRIKYSNFLISILRGRSEKFELKFPDFSKVWILQFYLTREAFRLFTSLANTDFDKIISSLVTKESALQDILTNKINKKNAKMVFQFDMRKTLVFTTFILNKKIVTPQLRTLIKNFSLTVHEILNTLNITIDLSDQLKNEIEKSLKNDIIRRYFQYLLKILLEKDNRLNLYIKFQYKQMQEKLNSSRYLYRLYEGNYSSSRSSFNSTIDEYLNLNLPNDIINNLNLLKQIVNQSSLKKNTFYYYSVLPMEVEEKVFDPSDVDRTGNSETKNILTDIDAILLISNKDSYELYLVEGKNLSKGFIAACTADLNRIKDLSVHPDIYKGPILISNKGINGKGGFLLIKG